MSLDTHPEARRVQIELMRRAPVWRKMELWGQLNHMAKLFALSGLRSRWRELGRWPKRRHPTLLAQHFRRLRLYPVPPSGYKIVLLALFNLANLSDP